MDWRRMLSRAWALFRRMPKVAQVVVAVFVVLLAIGVAAGPPEDDTALNAGPTSSDEDLPRASTTTEYTEPTFTIPTTTEAPTTVPPTTAPPVTAAPRTVPPATAPSRTQPPATAALAAPAQQSCTPGYSPCIPPGDDVDCAGGDGNGPRYVSGPVQVSGSDPYDLDRDNDGVGCENG